MKHKITYLLAALLVSPLAYADNHKDKHADKSKDVVLTSEAQQALTPEAVLDNLMEGNKRYVAGELTNQKYLQKQVKKTATGQYPQAIILSCVDSRVPVEMVFDQRVGDVFVARVAGNMENVDILGSMEFATAAAGSKLVMVLGHEACGAIKGACDHVQLGNLTALLAKLQPAVVDVQDDFAPEERTSKNKEFVEEVVLANVKRTVADIRRDSPLLASMEEEGKIKIVGAYYSLQTGEVSLVD
jgi:carbonic anhydrase